MNQSFSGSRRWRAAWRTVSPSRHGSPQPRPRLAHGATLVRRNGATAQLVGSKISGVSTERDPARSNLLLAFLLAYMVGSFIHHFHNAQFIDEYPNMPTGFPPAIAYVVWGAVTLVGLAGYYAARKGHEVLGLGALGVYAAYGLLVLGHYKLAPMSAHTVGANVTIWIELVTGALLLGTVAVLLVKGKD